MSTTAPATDPAAPLLPLRLPPGADLRRALEAFAAAQLDGAGFVLAGIGSLQDARLRLAAAVDDTLLPGPSELLTLAGSLSADGAHLHATLALADGRVVGGHLPYGNTVRTTAELLLAPLPGWRLRRVPDAATGYAELAVAPR